MKFTVRYFMIVAVLSFAGCPDYSHQRPVPDYSNMGEEDGAPVAVEDEANLAEER